LERLRLGRLPRTPPPPEGAAGAARGALRSGEGARRSTEGARLGAERCGWLGAGARSTRDDPLDRLTSLLRLRLGVAELLESEGDGLAWRTRLLG
jgi:hypothetical protein